MKLPFFTKPAPTQRRIVVVRSTDMRLMDWTRDPGLVKEARKILDTPEMQTMLAILRNESPSNYGLPMGANHDDRIAQACRSEGYHLALNTLEAMGKLVEEKEPLVATFEPEQGPQEPKA